ncbi:hypothetical protein GUITHDRAFT_75411 [Guillardia theta CCMP2712]|uniref:DNA-directed RNA polymerases I, II, and III subunit RPABC5 n=1 Tax=Guillardia theta (strain CCMP2712) TaxID=905079 RepID=L1IXE0_GUITC|nr:hypothetical protein GUITHDRAFT_75411 [Guillardia theta CCMP2712]EKX40554.1 hypothetical protein GUITHDRAFT_75411 [Guillardia theta CCMP2712]|eukprot:XP_005827534.1 hypothetical protein GUITHDRAFT_75411 [Guillardia theta CCMP2712]
MIIPIRCFTCNKTIGHMWRRYLEILENYDKEDGAEELGLKRYCCRRMLLTHVDLIEKLMVYNRKLLLACFL